MGGERWVTRHMDSGSGKKLEKAGSGGETRRFK